MIILFKSDCTGIFNVSTGLGHTISNLFDQVKYSMGNKNVTAKVKKVNSDDVSGRCQVIVCQKKPLAGNLVLPLDD